MKILVTGGNGFVGRNLVPQLIERGHDVTVFDNLSSDPDVQENDLGFRFIKGNIANPDDVKNLFKETSFDLVYHLSAIVGIKNYIERPFELVDVNIWGTRLLLEECMQRGTRLLFTSTSEIFGKNPNIPWKEDDDRVLGCPKTERWIYSNSKAICEHMIYAAYKQTGFPGSIVRYFNIFGPKQHPTNILSRNLCLALSGKNLKVYDDGQMQRCFTWVGDAIEGTIRAAEHPDAIGHAFNIGRAQPNTIIEIAQKVIEHTQANVDIEYVDTQKLYGNKYEDLRVRTPDVSRAKEILDWSADTPLDEGLAITAQWYKDNPDWWGQFQF